VQQQQGTHVLSVSEAFLGQSKIPARQGCIADSLPLVLDVGDASNLKSCLEIIERQS
jgi:hypothetical protein